MFPPSPSVDASGTLSSAFRFFLLNQVNSPEMRSWKSAMSAPSSSSVLVSGPTVGLPGLVGLSAVVPLGPRITPYWLVPANASGWRPALPQAPRRRNELIASNFQKLSSDTVHVAANFGYFSRSNDDPNAELSSKRTAAVRKRRSRQLSC